jgi:nucleotide-binding universal stress UspA family protein
VKEPYKCGPHEVAMSITRILVATDLTDRAERAVDRACQLKHETGATLVLVHVLKPGLPTKIESRNRSDADELLKERLRLLADHQPASADIAMVLVGDKFLTITKEAAKRSVDLILIGEPRKYRYDDFFVGTTAERVIRFSAQPVLVVKRPELGPYQRVLIAFDASEGAVRAMETALRIAPTAEFRIVYAWWPPTGSLTDIEAQHEALEEEQARTKRQIRGLIEKATQQLVASRTSHQIKLSIDLIENNPYVALRNELKWPDLVVIGTHARGRLAVSTVGRLARHLLSEATCDVLVAGP